MALATMYPPDFTPKENKEKRSNPSITSTNKGIAILHQCSHIQSRILY